MCGGSNGIKVYFMMYSPDNSPRSSLLTFEVAEIWGSYIHVQFAKMEQVESA